MVTRYLFSFIRYLKPTFFISSLDYSFVSFIFNVAEHRQFICEIVCDECIDIAIFNVYFEQILIYLFFYSFCSNREDGHVAVKFPDVFKLFFGYGL